MKRINVESSSYRRAASFFFFAIVTSVVVFILATSAGAAPPSISGSFSGLGFLPGGGAQSNASAISADGSVVVGGALSAFGSEAFRWTSAGGMVGLGDLPGGDRWSFAYGVSANGSVVVGGSRTMFRDPSSGFPIADRGFRWTASGGMVSLGTLGGTTGSLAWGTSADGSVIAGNGFTFTSFPGGGSSRQDYPTRWTSATGMEYLRRNGAVFNGVAHGISVDGSVIVGENSTAFRWTSTGVKDLHSLSLSGGARSTAYATSADGSVVVGTSDSDLGYRAFRWTSAGAMVNLGSLGGNPIAGHSSALAVSANGATVVGLSNSPTGQVAFLWTGAEGMVSLKDYLTTHGASNLTGWQLTAAQGISANGNTIVGYGTNPSGQTEAWIATIPEPSSVVLAIAALLTFALFASRRGRQLRLGM